MNPALAYEGGKLLLKAIKTDDASSAESSSTVDVNQYGDTPMEIKRTEGDLGYDETPVQEETPQEHIDEDPTANPMEVKEVADISATDKPQDTLPQSEPLKSLGGGGFSEIFSKDPGDASESFDDFFGNFLDEKENAPTQPVNYASTQDTGSSTGIPSGAPAIGSKEQSAPSQPLNVPKDANSFEEYQDIFDEFAKKEEEPLIQQAEKAYDDDKDIDDKELPFVEDDKSAEDVEDVVQAVEEGSLDEEKAEEVLQEAAADDGKIDDDELGFDSFLKSVEEGDPNYKNPKNELENESGEEKIPQKAPLPAPSPSINEKPQEKGKNAAAPETPKAEEKKSPAKEPLDKGVKLGSILYALFNPKSVSASSGETVAVNPYEDENASITSGGMGYDDEESAVESTSSSGSAPSSGGSISNISDTDYRAQKEQPVNTRVASQAGSGSIESKSQKDATSSGSSGTPVKGSVKEAFNKILAQGAAYAPSREGSSFESALGGERIGSSGGVSGGSLRQLPKEAQAKMQSEYEKIKQKVQATYKSWPKKGDLHVKEKGSVSIRTENGKEIGVKFGTRSQVSLELVAKNAPEKLGIVEEVI